MTLHNLTLRAPYLQLDPIFYHEIHPSPLKKPALVSFNPSAAKLIGLESDEVAVHEWEALLNGTLILDGSRPYAMTYAGHQFGHYVPRLGDGRAQVPYPYDEHPEFDRYAAPTPIQFKNLKLSCSS